MKKVRNIRWHALMLIRFRRSRCQGYCRVKQKLDYTVYFSLKLTMLHSGTSYDVSFRNTMVMEMQELDKLRSQVQDVNVPLEVFE